MIKGYINKQKLIKPKVKASYCPNCNNIDVSLNSYCKFCGTFAKRLTVGYDGKSYELGIRIDENGKCTNLECHCIPDNNARYCSTCGSKTTFITRGIITEDYF